MPYDRITQPPLVLHSANGRPEIDFDYYLPFGLTAIANKMSRSASRSYLRRFGVGINEWRILANLRACPGNTANNICQRSGLDKAAVSRSLALLDAAGMIETDKTPSDNRGRNLRLTPRGDALHDRLIKVALQREARLLTDFSPTERQLLLDFVARLHANIPLVQQDDYEDGSDSAE